MVKKSVQINLFQKTCPNCKGVGNMGTNPSYDRAMDKQNKGEIIMHWPDMYLYCQACNGTGMAKTTLGFAKIKAKNFIKDKLIKYIDKM
jgi:DnaJ-class molecular chaperone